MRVVFSENGGCKVVVNFEKAAVMAAGNNLLLIGKVTFHFAKGIKPVDILDDILKAYEQGVKIHIVSTKFVTADYFRDSSSSSAQVYKRDYKGPVN